MQTGCCEGTPSTSCREIAALFPNQFSISYPGLSPGDGVGLCLEGSSPHGPCAPIEGWPAPGWPPPWLRDIWQLFNSCICCGETSASSSCFACSRICRIFCWRSCWGSEGSEQTASTSERVLSWIARRCSIADLEIPATAQQGGSCGCRGRATPPGCHFGTGAGTACAIACGPSGANTKITNRQGYKQRVGCGFTVSPFGQKTRHFAKNSRAAR